MIYNSDTSASKLLIATLQLTFPTNQSQLNLYLILKWKTNHTPFKRNSKVILFGIQKSVGEKGNECFGTASNLSDIE